jgi:hypothetical protein
MHGHEGPELGLVTALLDDGRRTMANTRDQATMAELVANDCCGRPVAIDAGATVHLS